MRFMRPVPAAALATLLASAAVADHAAPHAGPEAASAIRAGDVVLTEGFTRATRPGAPVAGGFLTIANEGDAADRLVAARSPVAGRMEIHEMAMAEGVMKMRELPEGLTVGVGETVALAPGGYHLMFMELTGPLVEGYKVAVTLTFEKAGEVPMTLEVLSPDARSFEHGHDGHAG